MAQMAEVDRDQAPSKTRTWMAIENDAAMLKKRKSSEAMRFCCQVKSPKDKQSQDEKFSSQGNTRPISMFSVV